MSQFNTQDLPQLITIAQVTKLIGFNRASVYKYIRELNFPRPVKFNNSSRWLTSEVKAWVEGKIEDRAA